MHFNNDVAIFGINVQLTVEQDNLYIRVYSFDRLHHNMVPSKVLQLPNGTESLSRKRRVVSLHFE